MRWALIGSLIFVLSGCASILGKKDACFSDRVQFCTKSRSREDVFLCLEDHVKDLAPACREIVVNTRERIDAHNEMLAAKEKAERERNEKIEKYLNEHPEVAIQVRLKERELQLQEAMLRQNQVNQLIEQRQADDRAFYNSVSGISAAIAGVPSSPPAPAKQTDCSPSGHDGRGFSCTTR